MNEVQSWVFTICGGTMICGIISALIPEKTYEKAIQLLLGLFMLFCFLTPVTGNWKLPQVDIDVAEKQRIKIADSTGNYAEEYARDELLMRAEKEVNRILSPDGIEVGETSISIETDNSGSTLLVVTLPEKLRNKSQLLRTALSDAIGTEVELKFILISS